MFRSQYCIYVLIQMYCTLHSGKMGRKHKQLENGKFRTFLVTKLDRNLVISKSKLLTSTKNGRFCILKTTSCSVFVICFFQLSNLTYFNYISSQTSIIITVYYDNKLTYNNKSGCFNRMIAW